MVSSVVLAIVLMAASVSASFSSSTSTSFSSSLRVAVREAQSAKDQLVLNGDVHLANQLIQSLEKHGVQFQAPSQELLRRGLIDARRRAAPSLTGTCTKSHCLTQGTTCENPFRCQGCIDNTLVPCFVPPLFNTSATSAQREAAISACWISFNSCLNGLGGNCLATKNICSQIYLFAGPTFFGGFWNLSWTTTNCENTADTFVSQSCQYNYYCNNGTLQCSPHVAAGGACLYEADNNGNNKFANLRQCGPAPGEIFSDAEYECLPSKVCALRRAYRAAGDSCTAATASQCYTGVCSANKCTGYTVGQSCNFTQECAVGFYCSNASATLNTCVARVASGATCVPGIGLEEDDGNIKSGNPCAGNSICLTSTRRCGSPFQGTTGTACTENDECAFGTSFCSPTGCAVIPATRVACSPLNNNAECAASGADSSCDCFSPGALAPPTRTYSCSQPFKFDPTAQLTVEAAFNCSTVKGCHGIGASVDSCFYRECLDHWQCIFPIYQSAIEATVGDCVDFGPLFPGACALNPPNSDSSSAAALTFGIFLSTASVLGSL